MIMVITMMIIITLCLLYLYVLAVLLPAWRTPMPSIGNSTGLPLHQKHLYLPRMAHLQIVTLVNYQYSIVALHDKTYKNYWLLIFISEA